MRNRDQHSKEFLEVGDKAHILASRLGMLSEVTHDPKTGWFTIVMEEPREKLDKAGKCKVISGYYADVVVTLETIAGSLNE